jgi:hypothetical protein
MPGPSTQSRTGPPKCQGRPCLIPAHLATGGRSDTGRRHPRPSSPWRGGRAAAGRVSCWRHGVRGGVAARGACSELVGRAAAWQARRAGGMACVAGQAATRRARAAARRAQQVGGAGAVSRRRVRRAGGAGRVRRAGGVGVVSRRHVRRYGVRGELAGRAAARRARRAGVACGGEQRG